MEVVLPYFCLTVAGTEGFINQFIASALEILKKLDSAILNRNTKLAKDQLHQLKGSAGNSGMMHLYELCVKAEEHVLKEEWSETEVLYASIVETVEKLKLKTEI